MALSNATLRNLYAGGPRFLAYSGPAILLVLTASHIQAAVSRNSRELGGTFLRTDAECRLEASIYHLSFKVFGAVDAAEPNTGQEGLV